MTLSPSAAEALIEFPLDSLGKQVRHVPVSLDRTGQKSAILIIHSSEPNIDPFGRFFRFPKDSVKMALVSQEGKALWRKDLADSVIPGVWFCPVFPFDLDGDGVDEIYYVKNNGPEFPLNVRTYVLERLDANTGESTGQWEWPFSSAFFQSMTRAYRYFIMGGHVHGKPVLLTAQGTYGMMNLQAWNADMSLRWEVHIPDDGVGARGSHVTPILDLNGDGVDELMWGERCYELDRGTELFCADRETYCGHSDIVQPILDPATGKWLLFTAREQDLSVSPRVAMFNDRGERIWGAVEEGHMHWCWAAKIGDNREFVCMAARQAHNGEMDGEFLFEALTGKAWKLNASVYRTMPMDWDGDGYHELIRTAGTETEILDRTGQVIGAVVGKLTNPGVSGSKLLDYPGEQFVTIDTEGVLRIWGNPLAQDNSEAKARYGHPFYKANQKVMAVGYNGRILGGI